MPFQDQCFPVLCGTWWKADVCLDGTPRGYGVYEVNGNDVKWYYKSSGYPKEHQFRSYPAGASKEHPSDIIANVWNWDKLWKDTYADLFRQQTDGERKTYRNSC
jgi:formylglycine-generating enzyme required for sulfatase activity